MNYYETFILVAEDYPAKEGVVPIIKEGITKPIHAIQYDLISQKPYKLTQEDILFMVFAERNSIPKKDTKARMKFFEKNHPCLRSSALPKKYGWGVHFNEEGKAALFSVSSSEYSKFAQGNDVKLFKAMRNKRP